MPLDNALLRAALGENGTNLARATLEQILAGTLATDDDRAAVEATLDTLVAHPGEENSALLLRVLLAPDEIRPAERQGPWPARDLRAKAFDLIKPAATAELRAKLAEALADRLVRLAAGDPMREFLLATNPLNCSAQMVLYEKATLTKDLRTRLEQQLAGYSAVALGRLLELPTEALIGTVGAGSFAGGPAGGPHAFRSQPEAVMPRGPEYNPGAGSSGQGDASVGPRVAGLLWSEKSRALLEPLLARLPNLEKQPDLVLLAATIPYDSTRAVLARLLKKRWLDGPEALGTASLADRVTDPGLLVLVKLTTSRREAKTGGGAISVGPRGGPRSRTMPGGGNGRPGEGLNPAQKKEKAEQDWMTVSSSLVTAWCKRFQAIAQAKEKALAESGNLAADVAPKLPADFDLDAGARVISSCRVVWPQEGPPGMSDQKPSPLEVHYIRAEETGKPKKVLSFYKQQAQAKTNDLRTLDKSTWVDGLRILPQTGRRRSIDVLLSYSDSRAAEDMAKDDEEADLIVEILTVEIKDPLSRD